MADQTRKPHPPIVLVPPDSGSGMGDDDKTDPALPRAPQTKAPAASPALVAPTAAPAPGGRMPDLGMLDPLMKDPEITEIMVNDLRNIMIEKNGRISYAGFNFQSLDDLNRLTRNLLEGTGKALTLDNPVLDISLPDGSRVNLVGPPLTPYGACLTIRKFPSKRPGIEDLLHWEFLDRRMAQFLNACVLGRMNMLISGGTGSGKTTLLNALAGLIPRAERVVLIEETPELAILHPNSVKLITKPQTATSPTISARDLAANALRMRPDRIIIGECRRGEAFDIIQAMNTGHEGSMATLHANSARDALSRLETLCLLAGVDLPLIAIRRPAFL